MRFCPASHRLRSGSCWRTTTWGPGVSTSAVSHSKTSIMCQRPRMTDSPCGPQSQPLRLCVLTIPQVEPAVDTSFSGPWRAGRGATVPVGTSHRLVCAEAIDVVATAGRHHLTARRHGPTAEPHRKSWTDQQIPAATITKRNQAPTHDLHRRLIGGSRLRLPAIRGFLAVSVNKTRATSDPVASKAGSQVLNGNRCSPLPAKNVRYRPVSGIRTACEMAVPNRRQDERSLPRGRRRQATG